MYRIDLGTVANSTKENWNSYQLASLGGGGTRKFFFAPDVVSQSAFTAIMVGSGDREKPLNTTVAGTDGFYTVYDMLLTRGTPATLPTIIANASLGKVGTTETMTSGCYIPMAASEKIVNAPLKVEGLTYFGTNSPRVPDSTACTSNLGQAKVYSASAFCGVATSSDLEGGGFPPSPVAGIVHVNYTLPDGTTASKDISYVVGAPNSKKSSIEVSKVTRPELTSTIRRRLYWFMEGARWVLF